MKKMTIAIAAFSLMISACGAGNDLVTPQSRGEPAITDPFTPIEANSGDEFTIIIESNPTTGYHWEIVGDLQAIEFVSKDYNGGGSAATGSGGVDLWTFKAINPGEVKITFGYYPPSNDPTEPEQTVTFAVNIK